MKLFSKFGFWQWLALAWIVIAITLMLIAAPLVILTILFIVVTALAGIAVIIVLVVLCGAGTMTREEVLHYLQKLERPDKLRPDVFNAFMDRMKYRHFGHEETVDAWLWFSDGWQAHELASENRQC